MNYQTIAALLDSLIQLCHHMPLYFTQGLDWLSQLEWGRFTLFALLASLAGGALIVPVVLAWQALDYCAAKPLARLHRLSQHKEAHHG
ncbi:hypothetical protein [Chromobacterium subtsugae]|uniref:hypothetical protein n=1 Tax=Chromobacterium subtsugae TaxID=251747 RepID=UPI000640DCC9|nr:hypothetical protein [Chromobacterium subtsugae]OBU86110.1 hypothetical protein MY55_12350 [Chromobacterium subtsugae]